MGGNTVSNANTDNQIKDMEKVIDELISNGATEWNQRFPREHKEIALDREKVTIPDKADKYNQMMKGITAEPMEKKVKEVGEQLKKEGKQLTATQMRDLAAMSDFEYVKTLDDGRAEGGELK